ncbi:hypothetical protein [Lactococcus formosensis]|uniref:hypothetical protein n=1 Tax=Lactococcus formosensis TaxID=1281486 RepID=UPI00288F5763|nr:hypothetical protein [Lactococcus formosensis]MDT2726492.1 hypothetical protein [Lactococcus formosensis]
MNKINLFYVAHSSGLPIHLTYYDASVSTIQFKLVAELVLDASPDHFKFKITDQDRVIKDLFNFPNELTTQDLGIDNLYRAHLEMTLNAPLGSKNSFKEYTFEVYKDEKLVEKSTTTFFVV